MPSYTLPDRLLKRELATNSAYTSFRGLYGDAKWVKDLDIVNELGGHSGCVNALSWSKSGNLLASGSDDTYLNIHSYQPHDDLNPFSFSTTISTGHTANIFSVKFMPHSNDRTLVTAAGDSEIRIFDLEYSSRSTINAQTAQDTGVVRNGVRFMSEGDTNAKVFRSHSYRVKRIVTESSPHLFLSCSEDGEVRQWDLRQPSSAYPRTRGHLRGWAQQGDESDAPPPLISYARHHIDLNTISCSPSQPHYIVLGGAHLHAFLHDRRMMGRDISFERGKTANDKVREATQCVRRFAPRGQQRMKAGDNGHITACKISDAHPNNMIASWSGDHIYSFDLLRDPDAEDDASRLPERPSARKVTKQSLDRKRRRRPGDSTASPEGAARASPRQRTSQEEDYLAINYGNGQSEMIPLRDSSELDERQRRAKKIADAVVRLRRLAFTLHGLEASSESPCGFDLSPVLHTAASCINDIEDVIRTWKYPVDPPGAILAHTELRKTREATFRLVQALGVLARLHVGQDTSEFDARILSKFSRINPAPNETKAETERDRHTLFCLDFIKAITFWITSGPSALVAAFTARKTSTHSLRNPIPPDSGSEAISAILMPYLYQSASSDRPLLSPDSSRFETDESRSLFESERSAVKEFAQAVQRPFADLVSSDAGASQTEATHARREAANFWGFQVFRSLLKSAELVRSHEDIDCAFGGVGHGDPVDEDLRRQTDEVSLGPEDNDYIDSGSSTLHAHGARGVTQYPVDPEGDVDTRAIGLDYLEEHEGDDEDNEDNEYHDDDDDDDESDELQDEDDMDENDIDSSSASGSDADGEDDEDEDDDDPLARRQIFGNIERGAARSRVQRHVPCYASTRSYSGHSNVRTVKDVNFYGLNDEYIISGSDSGHFMVWDANTSKLLNILRADGEVVNVVQGHPYEPLIAVSGIDNTVKIFGADARARSDALKGIGVECTSHDSSYSDTLPRRPRLRPRPTARRPDNDGQDGQDSDASDASAPVNLSSEESDGSADDRIEADGESFQRGLRQGIPLATMRRMHRELEIMRRNERDRRGGNRDAFLTRGMLEQLAMRLRLRAAAAAAIGGRPDAAAGDDDDEELLGGDLELPNGRIVVADDCSVM